MQIVQILQIVIKYRIDPRVIYAEYQKELIVLMQKGTGNPKLPKIQNYNMGTTKLPNNLNKTDL